MSELSKRLKAAKACLKGSPVLFNVDEAKVRLTKETLDKRGPLHNIHSFISGADLPPEYRNIRHSDGQVYDIPEEGSGWRLHLHPKRENKSSGYYLEEED
jgi:hypothetical protein